jgi:hypothetical protein
MTLRYIWKQDAARHVVALHFTSTKGKTMSNTTSNEITVTNEPTLTDGQPVWMTPRTFEEAWRIAETFAQTDIVPKSFQNKPGNIFVVMGYADQMGISYLPALQGIQVINGIPAMYGDLMLAVVRGSGQLEYIRETLQDEGRTAVCTVKRKGEDEHRQTFSMDDAKRANLLGKAGPWQQYPKRMLQMRARGFALRDTFTDVLKGMKSAEEVQDMAASAAGAPAAALLVDQTASQKSGVETALEQINTAEQTAAAAKKRSSRRKTQKQPASAEPAEQPDTDAQQAAGAAEPDSATDSAQEQTEAAGEASGPAAEQAECEPDVQQQPEEDVPDDARTWVKPIFTRWANRIGRESEFVQSLGALFLAESLNDFAAACDTVSAGMHTDGVREMITDNEQKQYGEFVRYRTDELTADLVD